MMANKKVFVDTSKSRQRFPIPISFPDSVWECVLGGSASRIKKQAKPAVMRSQTASGNENFMEEKQ
jgi:hypothetical protein